jgi:hypothetical protein
MLGWIIFHVVFISFSYDSRNSQAIILLLGKVVIKNFPKSTDADRKFFNQHSLPVNIDKLVNILIGLKLSYKLFFEMATMS